MPTSSLRSLDFVSIVSAARTQGPPIFSNSSGFVPALPLTVIAQCYA